MTSYLFKGKNLSADQKFGTKNKENLIMNNSKFKDRKKKKKKSRKKYFRGSCVDR